VEETPVAHILIVDDTRETANLLGRLFGLHGHTAECLYEGAGVFDAMRAVRFDFVVLDVMMPEMDGFEVLRGIRAHGDPAVARVPVVMYSAIDNPREIDRAFAMGANQWVVKGTPFALLQKRLECFTQPKSVAG
jgi:DNA-binding response OmpR family regulator